MTLKRFSLACLASAAAALVLSSAMSLYENIGRTQQNGRAIVENTHNMVQAVQVIATQQRQIAVLNARVRKLEAGRWYVKAGP